MIETTNSDLVARLTEPQREALRLVAAGLESKQIGRKLSLSHHSIDRRIERAMQRLGAGNRYIAAKMVVEAEGGTYDPLARASSHLPARAESAHLAASDSEAKLPAEVPESAVRSALSLLQQTGFPWPFPKRGQDRAALDRKSRLAWALIGIPILVMIAWGLLLAGIGALDTLKL